MSTPILQAEADSLRTMPKRLTKSEVVYFANPGESMKLELESMDRRTAFLLDINRKGRIKLSRCTLQ